MTDTPEISVIIPVYNVEKYLPECLESVTGQTYGNLEAVCVNDGSTDGSGEILKSYAARDARVIAINQKNSGVAAARNTALEASRGKYIAFLDADDVLAPGFARKMSAALRSSPDSGMAWCAAAEGENVPAFTENARPAEEHKNPFSYYFLKQKPKIKASVWAKLFRRTALSGITFPENFNYGEDLIVLYQALYNMQKAICVPEELYFYRIREASAIHRPLSEMRMNTEIKIAVELAGIFEKRPMDAATRRAFDFFIARRLFNTVFKMPAEQDKPHCREWRAKYLPALEKLEKEGIFKPENLLLAKRLRYIWYKMTLA